MGGLSPSGGGLPCDGAASAALLVMLRVVTGSLTAVGTGEDLLGIVPISDRRLVDAVTRSSVLTPWAAKKVMKWELPGVWASSVGVRDVVGGS